MPFNDLQPTALLIPIKGPLSGRGYVFRGKNGTRIGGQMITSAPSSTSIHCHRLVTFSSRFLIVDPFTS
jgi:hypothetical protein